MDSKFEAEVMPVVTDYARRVFKDDERRSMTLVMAWYYWQKCPKDLPPDLWACVAVRAVFAGRDLPGIHPNRKRDAMHYAWLCGHMPEVMDRRPGPDKVAQDRELWDLFHGRLPRRIRKLARGFLNDLSGREVAKMLGVSPGRVTQLRQEAQRDYMDL
jgi:hypothetical protein